MTVVIVTLQAVLGLVFVTLGITAFRDSNLLLRASSAVALPRSLRWILGGIAVLGGLGLLASIVITPLAFFAAVPLTILCLIVFAVGVFGRSGAGRAAWAPLGLLVGLVAVVVLQPLGLRLLALPRTDALPVEPVASFKVIQRLPDHFWIEGLVFGPDGSLYTSATSGMDAETHAYSKATAKIFKRAPDGTESAFFSLPKGVLAGVLVVAADGTLYLTSSGATNGVWRISSNGQGELLARLPQEGWPNGMSFGPDGKLYITDASLGVLWRVDPATGKTDAALKHAMLKPRPFVSMAPGANGIHFRGRDAFIVASDRGKILRSHLNPDGSFEAPTVYASGVPGDDFTFAPDGTIYLATHFYNTVVRISPDGSRTIIADARYGVTGGTAAAFAPGDDGTLYVSTDDGAIAGNPKPNGTVVALKLSAAR